MNWDPIHNKNHKAVKIGLMILSMLGTAFMGAVILFFWMMIAYGEGSRNDAWKPLSLGFMGAFIIHAAMFFLMLFGFRFAYIVIGVVSILEALYWLLWQGATGTMWLPLGEATLMALTLLSMCQSSVGQVGFEVIVKEKEKPTE